MAKSKILFISTFPPAKCGIASFTQDLFTSINLESNTLFSISICALDNVSGAGMYNAPVSMIMDAHQLDACVETVNRINQDNSIELVCIEHEFGLYGGELGEYILGFLVLLEKPFIVRFHTVLPKPDEKRLKLVKAISLLADKIIVMTKNSARLLKNDYQIISEKIIIIPHGTHVTENVNVQQLKKEFGLRDKMVLTTFGLLSPNKGIEKGIMAMREISKKFPQAVYVVIGHTHPNLLQTEGEKYRDYLQQMIDEYGLQKNVRLINEYVPTKKLMDYLALTDVYLFTSKDPDQAVSGTFMYAMSAGCPIISNPFVLALEMLDERTGVILKGSEAQELADHAIALLENDQLRNQMGRNAFLETRNTTWKNVAQSHTKLFCDILGNTYVPSDAFTPVAG